MKTLIISVVKITFRVAFAYGLVLLFEGHINPLEWVLIAKVIFVVLLFVLLSQD